MVICHWRRAGGRARLLIDALMHSLWVHGALDALNPQYSYGSVFAFLAPLARMNLSSSSGAQIAFPSSSRILYGAVTPGASFVAPEMLGDFAADPAVAGAARRRPRPNLASLLLGDHLGCLDACKNPSFNSSWSRFLMRTNLLCRFSSSAHGSSKSPLKIMCTAWAAGLLESAVSTPFMRYRSVPLVREVVDPALDRIQVRQSALDDGDWRDGIVVLVFVLRGEELRVHVNSFLEINGVDVGPNRGRRNVRSDDRCGRVDRLEPGLDPLARLRPPGPSC